MARKPTPTAPAKPRTARTAATAVPTSEAPAASPAAPETAQSVLDDLTAFAVRHRCTIELPSAKDLVPGATVQVRVTGPQSAEALVSECRTHPLIRDVQLLAAHIAIDIVVPAAAAKD